MQILEQKLTEITASLSPLEAPWQDEHAAKVIALIQTIPAAVLFGPVWADSGTFAIWSLGLPVVVTLVPLLTAGSRFGVAAWNPYRHVCRTLYTDASVVYA